MADQEAAAKRAAGLTRFFNATIHGHRKIQTAGDSNQFLEALCAQEDASKCVECLIASSAGLEALGSALRRHVSGDCNFLNGLATATILHFSKPSFKQLYGGQFLQRVLEQIVQPPTFWNTLVEAHDTCVLSSDGTRAFAWLLHELLYSRSENDPSVRDIAQRITNNGSFVNADILDVRNIGHKIKHVLDSTSDKSADGPGGRHDNDFAQIHKIKLLPTPDEFASSERPFYRRADSIASVAPESRGLTHVDNQFRLLREDLLGELRNDFQIASGQKKGRRKTVLEHLKYVGIDCGPETKRKPCSLKLLCPDDIPQLRNVKAIDRRKHLAENKNVLKHQSLGCLISDGSIVAFATVDRDEDLLAQQPAIVVLRVADASSFGKVLMACKLAADLCFVQVDTAVFAYEPILKGLQSLTELPLEDQLLSLTLSSPEAVSGIQPTKIINAIRDHWEEDLQDIIGSTHSIKLDQAQADSLLTGLLKRVSLTVSVRATPRVAQRPIDALQQYAKMRL